MSPRPKAWAIVLAVLTVAGCTLSKSGEKKEGLLPRVGGKGQVIEPKRCALQVAILSRPLHDPVLDAGVWSVADEQVLAPEVRHALEVNGLRIGLITGTLPGELEAILNAPPPHKIEPAQFLLPDGDHALIPLNGSTPTASLLLCRDNRAYGKDYSDASGRFWVAAQQEGPSSVSLRFVPEICHGPVRQAYSAVPIGGLYAPQNFTIKESQEVETLRDLAATLIVQPGQVAVLGCRADKERSLGTFLFTEPEANSDRLLQKVTLIWASRSSQDLPTLEPVEPPDMPHSSRQKEKAETGDNSNSKKAAAAKDGG
jgi:hypothetical protein